MKKKSLLLAALTTFAYVAVTVAQVPSYVPTNGLVGWWPFNGNANDESGNGNNGTVNGATLTTDRFGNSNQAYDFNAFNWNWGSGGDYIYIPYNSSFNSAHITVSVWFLKSVNYITNQTFPSIVKRFEGGYNNPNGQTWGVIANVNDQSFNTFILPPNNTNNYTVSLNHTGPIISSSQWHNGILSFDGISMKTYFDGQLISSVPANGMLMNANGNSGISIGMSIQANGHWDPFNGKIDDIGIWNRALTQQEITDLFNAGLNCANNTTITPQTNSLSIGGTATFTATTSDPNPNYIWQSNFGQGFQTLNNFGNYTGANTATLNIANVQLANHNQLIRVISSSGNCIDTSNVANIIILDTCISNITVYDTITTQVVDTTYITQIIYDTLLTSVTDTLIINATLTNLNPPNNQNTLKVYPNPASTDITIDYGNFALMNGYTLTIVNATGQTVFTTPINQQISVINLSSWTGNGIYFVRLTDQQNNLIENRKIVIQ